MFKKYEGDVYLEPIDHVYIHKKTGKRYDSVTRLISKLEHEFDSEGIALAIERQSEEKKKEIYRGLDKQGILDLWKKINDEANEYGTKVHNLVEVYLLKQKWFFPKEEFDKLVLREFDKMELDFGKVAYPERILFSEKYNIAGTSDLIIDVDDEYFEILDWKGLSIDTPILTTNGWKTMGDIKIKDKVYDMNGKIVTVLHTSKIKNKKCYKISFNTNESVVSDFEHRWLISFCRERKVRDVIMTTEELFNYLNENKRSSDKIPKIRVANPIENNEIDLPIDPYVLGVWLGDGHSADSKITNMYDMVVTMKKSKNLNVVISP